MPSPFVFSDNLQLGHQSPDGFHQELLRGLTHKLNNLIGVIQGFGSLIQMNGELDESDQESMQHIREASVNIHNLSERIRAAGGCANVRLQSLNLPDYLNAVDTSLQEPFITADVPFEMQVAPSLPPVQVDPAKLKVIILELLKNAAESAQINDGTASMRVTEPGVVSPLEENRVDILVINTGVEISPEKLPTVFQPFNGSKPGNHLGLGLTIAAMLAHQTGIKLGIASEAGTTTCWMSVPVAE